MSAAIASIPSSQVSPGRASARILTVTPFFPSQQRPSQGCFIAEPLQRLQELGIESEVVAVTPFYRGERTSCVSGSQWTTYYSVPGNLGLLASRSLLVKALRRQLRDHKWRREISLIHAHAALPCGEAALALAKEFGVPFVVTVHGLDVLAEEQTGRLLGPWTKRRSLAVYREADRIICISKRVRAALPDEVRHHAIVVHNGVDSVIFRPEDRPSDRLTVLSVGNLIPIKGHAVLMRAFARIEKTFPGSELVLIGDGPERGRLNSLAARLGIESRVRFLGQLDRQAVARAMQNCAVFALPSRYEGLGCVYLEAMACARPAIGCSGQGIGEIIRDSENGFLVAPDDEDQLARTLARLLLDASLRKRVGTAARETILQKHTLEHQARDLASVYEECMQ